MSLGSKITLGASVMFTASIVTYVHIKQRTDRESLREGVIKDIERQNMRKENIKAQHEQIELTKVLRRQQELEQQQTESKEAQSS